MRHDEPSSLLSHLTQAALTVSDRIYAEIFADMGRGIFAKEFRYDHDRQKLYYMRGKKRTPVKLGDSPADTATMLIKLLKKNGMCTQTDIDTLVSESSNKRSKVNGGWKVTDWRIRRTKLHAYLSGISASNSLTSAQDKKLRQVVFTAFCCDLLGNDVVSYDGVHVTNIDGLEYERDAALFRLRCLTRVGIFIK